MSEDRPCPHEFGPSRVGHGEAQCKWCLGTNRELAIIAPNHCETRAERDPEWRISLSMEPVARDAEGRVLMCSGCGSIAPLEALRSKPGVLSCCPERKMVRAIPAEAE